MLIMNHVTIDVMSAVSVNIGTSIDPEMIDMIVIDVMIIEARTGKSGGQPKIKKPPDIT